MKVRFVFDMDVNAQALPTAARSLVRMRKTRSPSGREIEVPYFPAGTEYETPHAEHFVRNGEAVPVDEECRAACADLDEPRFAALQHAAQRQRLGISPKDWPLYDAGFIRGYDDKGEYLPGAKWDEYQAKLAAEAEDDEEDDL